MYARGARADHARDRRGGGAVSPCRRLTSIAQREHLPRRARLKHHRRAAGRRASCGTRSRCGVMANLLASRRLLAAAIAAQAARRVIKTSGEGRAIPQRIVTDTGVSEVGAFAEAGAAERGSLGAPASRRTRDSLLRYSPAVVL